MSQIDNTELLNQVRNGDRQALAKAITVIENTGIPFEIAESAGAQVLGERMLGELGQRLLAEALLLHAHLDVEPRHARRTPPQLS